MTIPEKFIEIYQGYISNDITRRESFCKACDNWIENKGCDPPYSSYESFKVVLSRIFNKS